MKKITKNELYNIIEEYKGKKQYLFATFNGDVNYFIDILKNIDLITRKKHISNHSRIINDFKVLSNGFKINDSGYHFIGKTNIYKIDIDNYIYIILHKIDTNYIVIYEMVSDK